MEPKEMLGAELMAMVNLLKRTPHPCGDGDITLAHCRVIGCLMKRGGEAKQKELEEEFAVRRSTVCRIVQLMEKKGLVARETGEEDARSKRIRITDRGRQVHRESTEYLELLENRLIQGLSSRELAAFRRTLGRMRKNLEEATSQERSTSHESEQCT